MAAPTESGYGLGVKEDGKTVDIDEIKRQVPKIVSESVEGVEGGEEKSGSDACPEGLGSEEHGGDEQVAKKPRLEKAENGGAEEGDEAGYGVEGVEGIVDKGDGEHEELNGTAEAEGEDAENCVVGAGEETAEGVTDKDAAPGDVGLRTLLQEGDDTKTSVANHGADATHMLNGAK